MFRLLINVEIAKDSMIMFDQLEGVNRLYSRSNMSMFDQVQAVGQRRNSKDSIIIFDQFGCCLLSKWQL